MLPGGRLGGLAAVTKEPSGARQVGDDGEQAPPSHGGGVVHSEEPLDVAESVASVEARAIGHHRTVSTAQNPGLVIS